MAPAPAGVPCLGKPAFTATSVFALAALLGPSAWIYPGGIKALQKVHRQF
ncbi:MAG: hypothetical protein QXF75_05740 [Candidatus Bathyarchaeia archaeon]